MSGINCEVTMSIKDIFQSGKDVVCKMKGGFAGRGKLWGTNSFC